MKLWRALVALLLIGSLGLAACGDDEDDTASPTGDNGEQAAGGDEEFCGTVQQILQTPEPDIGEDTPPEEAQAAGEEYFATMEPLSADAVEQAPEEIKAEVETMNSALQEAKTADDPESVFMQPDVIEADSTISEWTADNCAFAEDAVEVAGVEYEFNGVPDTVSAGDPTVFRFENEGEELHELVLFRINDDVDQSIEELLQLPQEEAEQKAEFVTHGFALPGNTDLVVASDLEPGRYGMVCFLPVGATPEAFQEMMETGEEPEGGPPHFTRGMHAEFTVE